MTTTMNLGQLLRSRLGGIASTEYQEKEPVVRADGQSHVQMHLMAARQQSQDLDTLIAWLRDNHTSPWSHGGPLGQPSWAFWAFDVAAAQQLVEEVRDYYTLRWAHAKMTQGGQTSEWRQTIIRCLNGQVHQDRDEGAVASLYWLYQADRVREGLPQGGPAPLPGDPKFHDLRLRGLERSVRFGRRHGPHKWMVDYWWLDQEDRLILWPVRQNDQGLTFLDWFWKQSRAQGTQLSVRANCQPVRDWVLGPISTVVGAELLVAP
jgi:hypothetical protein